MEMGRMKYTFSCSTVCHLRQLQYIGILCLLSIMVYLQALPADAAEQGAQVRPRIGLVLGGGGAKGAAHIGVLKVLEELKIPVDYIAGTSMGAIVGALYASGLTAPELEKVITEIDWKDVFSGEPDRRNRDFRRKREDYDILVGLSLGVKDGKVVAPRGLIKDQKVNVLFETLMLHTTEIDDFDKLPIPYRAVAADLETGEMVVFKGGRLADAARASMSVPGAFPPIELNGRFLIDGGMVRNLPVDIVREMGADIIICVNVGKPLADRKELTGPLPIMNQMLDIMIKTNVDAQIRTLGPKDVYINPELGKLSSGDFDKASEIALLGEKAARVKLESLKRYSVSDEEYAVFTALHHAEQVKEIKIASVEVKVEGETNISAEVVSNRLSVKPGDTINVEKLKDEAGIVFGTGDFERVDLHVRRQREGYDLLVKAREKSWGPNYLRFGMALETDFMGWSKYNILVDYTRRWVNRLGAEWKTKIDIGSPSGVFSEFYQPLSVTRLFFIAPHVRWKLEPVDIYQDNKKVAQYDLTRYEGGIDLGYQPSMYGEMRLGLRYAKFNVDPRIGELELPRDKVDRGAVVLGGMLDQIDNVNFPNKGYLAEFELLSSMEALGSDDNYTKVKGRVLGVYTFKRQTVLASLVAGTHIGNDLPYYDEHQLGGFLNLSGLHSNQLRGQHMAIGKLISYHKVGQSFIGDLYLGASLECGNVWKRDEKAFDLNNLRLAGSLFFGYDTIFGPLYIAWGHADGGVDAGYLYLGRTF